MGRPSKPLVTRELLAGAVLRIVDAKGDFTMSEVAAALGVQAASLYHHVDGRAGIVELLRDAVAREIRPIEPAGRPWEDVLTSFARDYLAAFAAHPRAITLLAMAPIRSAGALEHYERLASILEDNGVPQDRIIEVITALDCFVLGSALDVSAEEVSWAVDGREDTSRLAAAIRAQRSSPRSRRAFEFGLAALVAAVGRLQGRPPESAR